MLDFLQKNEKKVKLLFCVFFNALLFYIVLNQNASFFQTNDDYRMRLIASGMYTGEPENQLVFMKIFIGYILQFLYFMNSSVSWYDWFVVLSMFIPVTYLFYYMIKDTSRFETIINVILYFAFYSVILKKHLLLPQFTITAALLALGAILALINIIRYIDHKNKVKIHICLCIVFNLMCFGVRDEIYLLLFALEVFIVFIFVLHKNKYLKKIGVISSIIILFLVFGQLVEMVPLNHVSYQNFKDYTKSRSNVYDYYSIPTLEEDEKFYEETRLDPSLVEPIKTRTLDVDEELNTELYNSIYDYNKEKNSQSLYAKIKQSLLATVKFYFSSNMIYQTLLIACFVVLTLVIGLGDTYSKHLVLGCIGYIIFVPFLLHFRGRLVERLLEAIYLITFPLLIYVIKNNFSKIKEKIFTFNGDKSIKIITGMMILLCLSGLGLPIVMLSRDTIYQQHQNILYLSDRLEALTEYAQQHPDNFYFYNSLDFIGGSDKLFNNKQNTILNIDSLGNWNAKSDTYYKRNEKFGFTSAIEGITKRENVYYVECWDYHNSMDELLKDKYKMEMEKVDTFQSSQDVEINVYHVKKMDERGQD